MSYNLLKGKKGLIFGALNENSIAWKVARRAVEEGAEIVLTNTAVSIRMGTINQLAEQCGTIVVPADATSVMPKSTATMLKSVLFIPYPPISSRNAWV